MQSFTNLTFAILLGAATLASAQVSQDIQGNVGLRGLVQGGNGQVPCNDPAGCEWGGANSAYIERLWVTHPRVHWRCVQPKMIALTFDDGMSEESADVLDQLKAVGVKATFFLTGSLIDPISGPILARAAAEGHTIAHHGFTHTAVGGRVNLQNGNPDQATITFFEQMITGTITAALPYIPASAIRPYFRPPYLSLDKSSADYLAQAHNLYIIQINADTKDYEAPSSASIVNALQNNIYADSTKHSWITLQHDAYGITAAAIPAIVANAKAKGYRFVDMDECLGYPVGTKPPTTKPTKKPSNIATQPPPTKKPTPGPTFDQNCSPNFQAPRGDYRCGAAFGWAGCVAGESCSEWSWCHTNPTANVQALPVVGQTWAAPLPSYRCGASFDFAGCPSNECCDGDSYCSSTCVNTQQLIGFACSSSVPSPTSSPKVTKAPSKSTSATNPPSTQCTPAWQPPLGTYRCGASFGWAGCISGESCSEWSWCNEAVQNNVHVLPAVGQIWSSPTSDLRCGPSFNFAGCAAGSCCDEDSFCRSTCQNPQILDGFLCL